MAKRPTLIRATDPSNSLAQDVIAGLRKTPKQLSPVWFYDELGSFLFDNICELPEYYITRIELEIMREHCMQMAHFVGRNATIIEFGSGTSLKTRTLLDCLDMPATYVPVDIAREHLLDAAASLARDYPELRVVPVCADFTQDFELPRALLGRERRTVYFPGSTIGNFEPDAAQQLLARMRRLVGAHGAVLIGIDLRKDPRILQRAYNDSAGITGEFNVNALRHVNRELGANFDLSAFQHQAVWVEEKSRIEMHLVSTRDQAVDIAGETIAIARGERLCTEFCHKYTLESFANLAATADLAVSRVWMDPQKLFSVQLLEPRTIQ